MLRTNLATLDRFLARLTPWQTLAISAFGVSAFGVAVVFVMDYVTGNKVSVALFYLVPVATASWSAGRRASVSMSVLACVSWFVADISAGHPPDRMAIPVWNALIRFGFFLVNGYLVVALRDSLFHQRNLVRTDALTGVFGRRVFEDRPDHDLDLARRTASPLTIACIDVDDFKSLRTAAITFEKSVPMLQEAVSAADALMYEAQHQGRNRVVFRIDTDTADVSTWPGRGNDN